MELFSMEVWALIMFATLMVTLLLGYPVAFTLGAVALLFGSIFLDLIFFNLLPMRIWGIIKGVVIAADKWGKYKTVAQMAYIILLLMYIAFDFHPELLKFKL